MYAFYLDKIQLPVTPAKMNMKIANQNKTINLINDGEVNILKAPGLTEISFDAMIPQVLYPFAVYTDGFKEAAYYLDKLETLKVDKKPFQFLVSRVSPAGKLLFDTNMSVSLEEYTIDEDVENGLDLIVSLKLKQYRTYGTKKVVVKQTQNKKTAKVATTRASTKTPAKTHKVTNNETLWSICKKVLGDGSKYKEIAKLNNIKNPDSIQPGQVIRFA
ncbi:LysM peptidoglycan-binding domain-containing protein [Heyndrickxia oleronia]|uniref:LysM peptidoglycan-binding domain-containing protein n=1 Tax=Heyndrickxia oleronia TaxID=38875 RepID=UPI00333900B0